MTPVSVLVEPSPWAILAGALAPFVGPLVGACAAIAAVGLGQWLTYAREEAARLRREKREAAAQALAAYRDLETARVLAAKARTDHDSALRSFIDFQSNVIEARNAIYDAEEAEAAALAALAVASERDRDQREAELTNRTAVRERAERRLDLEKPLCDRADERARSMSVISDDARHAWDEADRHVSYCWSMLDLACASAVSDAFGELVRPRLDAMERSQAGGDRDKFMEAVRSDIEAVTVRACLWRGTMPPPWQRHR